MTVWIMGQRLCCFGVWRRILRHFSLPALLESAVDFVDRQELLPGGNAQLAVQDS